MDNYKSEIYSKKVPRGSVLLFYPLFELVIPINQQNNGYPLFDLWISTFFVFVAFTFVSVYSKKNLPSEIDVCNAVADETPDITEQGIGTSFHCCQ